MKKFKKNLQSFIAFVFTVILLFLILLGCKEIALGHVLTNLNLSNPIFDLDYALNEGAAFGLLQQQSAFLCGVAAFILCLISCYVWTRYKKITKTERFALAMVCAGIISNTLERLKAGAVIDYINLNFISFPIFNLADVFICVGVVILVFILFFKR